MIVNFTVSFVPPPNTLSEAEIRVFGEVLSSTIAGEKINLGIIFCDEAENLTTAQIQLLIGRIGEGSQLWLAGDRKQTDKAIFDKDSGIGKMIERLRGKPLYAYVNLEKCERSAASAYADYLD